MPGLDEQLRTLREQAGFTQKQLAERLGVDRSTVTGWETGRSTPTYRILLRLAELFGVSLDSLTGLPSNARLVDEGAMVPLPVYGTIQAGRVGFITEEPEEERLVPADKIAGGRYFWLRVEGDCMAPRFHGGDYALVRLQPEVENGEIAAVVLDDEATLKRVFRTDHQIILRADNPTYPPILADNRKVRIIGKVVGGSFDLNT